MFGPFGFFFAFSFANLFLIMAVVIIISTRRAKRNIPWLNVIGFLVLQAISSYVLLPRYYHQFENYRFMKTLRAEEVVRIQVDSTSWSKPQDVERIVGSLNKVVWHEANHDVGVPSITMTITLQSGDLWEAHLARYRGKEGAIFEFFRPMNDEGAYWIDGTAFVPELTITLESIGYALPFE